MSNICLFIILKHQLHRKVAGAIRVVYGRRSVETHAQDAITEQNKMLSQLFEISKIELKDSDGSSTMEKYGVYVFFHIFFFISKTGVLH